jgi:hypothetical protein
VLKLNVNPMRRRWTKIQQTLAKAIIEIGMEVLKENLHIECKVTPLGNDGHYTLQVASDTRWDKPLVRLAGCVVSFGLQANLPIGIELMSSICIKCRQGIEHDADVCQGLAKGMEAAGASTIVRRLFENLENKCHVANLVTDKRLFRPQNVDPLIP